MTTMASQAGRRSIDLAMCDRRVERKAASESPPSPGRRVLRAVIPLLLMGGMPLAADYGMADDLQPTTYSSPSGTAVLTVDPSQRSGAGKASYRLDIAGKAVWTAEHPFTLWSATVAEDGTVGGYAYSRGYNGTRGSEGEFLVVILDPLGKARLVESTPRRGSLYLHTMGDPKAAGLFLDPENDRLVVRVSDSDLNARSESWWIYRLSIGKPVGRSQPKSFLSDAAAIRFVIAARPVAGTPLTLVHWYRYDGVSAGARFTLVDDECRPVWSLELAADYTNQDQDAQQEILSDIWDRGAIFDGERPSTFEIRHVATELLVTYAVDSSTDSNWSVREISAEKYVDEKEKPEKAEASAFEDIELQRLGSIQLRMAKRARDTPIHDIVDFSIDDRGRLGFLRRDRDGAAAGTFVVVDRTGRLVRSLSLPLPDETLSLQRVSTWVAGDRWLVTTSELGTSANVSALWVDIRAGTVRAVEGFESPTVAALASTHDGGFVVLTSSDAALLAFDAAGKRRWSFDAESEAERNLSSAEDIAVTSSGEIVVLVNIYSNLEIYGLDGVHHDSIDLEASWRREPNYPTGVEPDVDGGVVVIDFNTSPSVVRTRRDGTVVAEFDAAYADGRGFDLVGNVQRAPDGRLWTSDGQALLRLDERGVVDFVLGETPNAHSLGRIARIGLDSKGGIFAVDARTGGIHAFEERGRVMRILRPDPSDFHGELSLPVLAVCASRDVYLSPDPTKTDYLHFDPRGDRVGIESIDLDEVAQEWICQPGSENRWIVGYRNLYLVDPQGKLLRRVERTSNGLWLEDPGPAAASPAGSIAVVSGQTMDSLLSGDTSGLVFAIFAASGEAISTWPVPRGLVTTHGIAFDGARIVAFADLSEADRARANPTRAVVALGSRGEPIFRFVPPQERKPEQAFLVPVEGRVELWLFDGFSTIDRYAMP